MGPDVVAPAIRPRVGKDARVQTTANTVDRRRKAPTNVIVYKARPGACSANGRKHHIAPRRKEVAL